MGIGTSLGAFFDSELDHHAGNDTGGPPVPQPEVVDPTGKTRDDNAYSVEGDLSIKTTDPQPIGEVFSINPMLDHEDGTIPMGAAGGGLRTPERVGNAALQIQGKIYEGRNHGEAFEKYMDKNPTGELGRWKDGFTTSHGRFVSREEALSIAKARNQLQDKGLPDSVTGLLSEDLQ